jgi:hypothetical protein
MGVLFLVVSLVPKISSKRTKEMSVPTLEIMCGNRIWRRAIRLFGMSYPAHSRVMEEGGRQAAKLRESQKIDDEDIDACVNACRKMENEPSIAVLSSWRFLPADPPAPKFNGLSVSDQIRARRYR